MNICVLDYDINPPWVEAVRILAYELSRQLVRQGHSVHVITSAAPRLPLEEELDGVLFHRIPRKPFLSYFLARKVKKLHQSCKFDVIHIQNALMTKPFIMTLILLKKWVRVPMIAYLCQSATTSPRDFIRFLRLKPREEFSRLAGWLVGVLTPNFFVSKEFNMVGQIITSSNYLKTQLTHAGVEFNKIKIIYPFINTQEFATDARAHIDFREKLGISKTTPLILYVGPAHPTRLGGLLKALPIVLREMPDSRVVLVSQDKKQFFNLVAKLGLESAFVFLPQHMKINMARLMVACNVFVYTGYSGIVTVDPPLTIIEAMMLGVPIVAANTGDIPAIVRDYKNCFLIEPFDYKGIAKALIKMLKKTYICSPNETLLNSVRPWSIFDSKFASKHFISIYEDLMRASN